MTDSDYEVLGGHENAEFRRTDDGIELFSTEEMDGETIGHVGDITEDELQAVGEALDHVFNGGPDDEQREAESPELHDLVLGQHPLTGAMVFLPEDDEDDGGAVFSDPQDIIDAADAL